MGRRGIKGSCRGDKQFMATCAHDELSGHRYGAEAGSRRVRKEGYRAGPAGIRMQAPGTMASLAADHRTRHIPRVSCCEVVTVPVGVMTTYTARAACLDETNRRDACAVQVSCRIEIRVLARKPVGYFRGMAARAPI